MAAGDADDTDVQPRPGPEAGPHLTGQLILSRVDYLRRTHGPEAVQEVFQSMEEADRRQLQGVDRGSWYSFGLLVRLDRAIARRTAPDDDGIFERIGEASARHRTEWVGDDARLFSVHGFLSRVAEEHERFHTFGRAVYRRTGFDEGAVAYSEYPEMDPVYCRSALGFFRGAVAFLTGRPAHVVETSCQCRGDIACVFIVRWRAAAGAPVR